MARASMATLIATVRRLAGDGGTASGYDDDDVQAFLDDGRMFWNRLPLRFDPQPVGGGGTIQYLTAAAGVPGVFEGYTGGTALPGTVYDANGGTVGGWTMTTAGLVTFATDQAGSARYWTGYSYDQSAAAADLVDGWSGKLATAYSFTTDGQTFQRSHQFQALTKLAERLRRQALPRVTQVERTDERCGFGW